MDILIGISDKDNYILERERYYIEYYDSIECGYNSKL